MGTIVALAMTMGVTFLGVLPAQAAGETVVSLTFDDGNADQMPAAATLKEKNLPGTFFINSGYLNQPGWMSTADLATLKAQGHEIGGHSLSHPFLDQVPADEAQRQVCNDRVALSNLGYKVTSFAYPFASSNASVEAIVALCGYNSARGLGDLRTAPGTDCASCDFAESMPPTNPFWTRAADQIDSTWTLERLQSTITDAAANGGGWVQLTFHHVCDGCDELALSPAVFDQFTTWLAGWQNGVTTMVKTVDGVIGGAEKPLVSGPAFVPPPAVGPGVNAVQNPGFEEIAASGLPSCWWDSFYGINTVSFATVSPGRTGNNASQITVSGYTTGDAKRLQIFDGGVCAPTVVAGQTYSLRAWYKSTGLTQFTVYYRQTDGSWLYGTSSPWFAAATDYTQAVWTTPSIPAGVNGISFALNVFADGQLTTDDYAMYNTVGAPPSEEIIAPAPTITGTAQVGSVLTATAGTWTPAPVALAYQWLVGGTAVTGATDATYTPVAADLGKTVTVQVTGTKADFATKVVTSAATAAVAAADLVAATPTITGTAQVGSVLTADAGAWTPAPVDLAYQWSVGGTAVTGATATSYTPVAADLGKTVTVQVTGTKAGYATKAVSSVATAAVVAAPLLDLVAPAPTITGTAQVGSALTANPGAWTPAPVDLAYQWSVGGTAVTGATAAVYTPVAADVGKTVTVQVTGTKAGYAPKVVTSAPSGAVIAATLPQLVAPAPTITGSAKVGSVLTANAGAWTPAPVALTYQWLVGNVVVTGATAASYTPVAADVGKTVTVRVTGTKAGYAPKVVTSAPSGAVAAATLPQLVAPAPTITGTAQVGSVLRAQAGTWTPAPVALAYQWLVGNTAVSGATAASYTPVAADTGKTVTVRVTGTKAGYTTKVLTSVATPAVAAAPPLTLIAPTPTITGTARVGSVLTAKAGVWGPAPVALAYQWLVGNTAVSGATAASYTPAAADAGKTVTVRVTGSKAGYASKALTSAATPAVTAAPKPATATRLAGADRYETSALLSAATFKPGVPVVYIATGDNFPDALSGGPAAGIGHGPMLLVSSAGIPSSVNAELRRLKPARIVVLGGSDRVSAAVESALAKIAPTSRIAGADRYDTSARISASVFKPGVAVAYVATGQNFPDALSGGAAAGAQASPVLLVTPTSLPASISAELKRLKPKKIVVLGGTGTVSAAVASALNGIAPTSRIAGADRFETSASISRAVFAAGVKVVYLATGEKFPDALAGGPAAISGGAPVLLVTRDSIPATVGAELTRLRPQRIVVLGGPTTVSDAVLSAAKKYLP